MIRFWAVNANFGTGAAKDSEHVRHLLAATPVGWAVVLCFQEVKNLRRGAARLRRLLARIRGGGSVFHDEATPAKAGTALAAWGVRLRNGRLWQLGKFRGTLTRYVAIGRVGNILVQSVHVPPERSGRRAQDAAIRRVKRRTDRATRRGQSWVVAIDANMPLGEVARRLGGDAYGEGIVGLVCSRDLDVTGWGVDRYGKRNGLTDHWAIWIDVKEA